MKAGIYISILVLGLGGNVAFAQSAMPTLLPEEEIMLPMPSEEQLLAFEVRVEQKWEDLIAYLNILSQHSGNEAMKEVVLEELNGIFIHQEVVLWTQDDLPTFLDHFLTQKNVHFASVPGSFGFFGFDWNEEAQTFLGFARVQLQASNEKELLLLTIDVVLDKERKLIGGNHREVWVVKFGHIRQIGSKKWKKR